MFSVDTTDQVNIMIFVYLFFPFLYYNDLFSYVAVMIILLHLISHMVEQRTKCFKGKSCSFASSLVTIVIPESLDASKVYTSLSMRG